MLETLFRGVTLVICIQMESLEMRPQHNQHKLTNCIKFLYSSLSALTEDYRPDHGHASLCTATSALAAAVILKGI
jgi:hypothetical protein